LTVIRSLCWREAQASIAVSAPLVAKNAVLRYKKRPPTSEEITSELGASYLVAEA
jgi:hypothetical protein